MAAFLSDQTSVTVQRSKSLPFSITLTNLATCFCSPKISTKRPAWYHPVGSISVAGVAGTAISGSSSARSNPLTPVGALKFAGRATTARGAEFAGIVEKVGRGVANYKVGDEVFGTANHSLAEYVVAKEKNIWRKPANVSFEQASTIPVVGECAFNVFDKLIAVKKGSEVLINGATGGIGMYVTQIAKQRGAIVTAVVSPKGIALVQKWGVDFVVNYREIDILTAGKQYGVVVELSDKLLFKQAKAIMKPTATYVASLPIPLEILSGLVNNLFSSKKYKLLGTPVKPAYMAALANDAANGAIDIVIGKAYPLTAFKEAYAETAHGKFVGKVVFTVA